MGRVRSVGACSSRLEGTAGKINASAVYIGRPIIHNCVEIYGSRAAGVALAVLQGPLSSYSSGYAPIRLMVDSSRRYELP